MTVFRWIVGVLAALFATGALVSLAVYVSAGIDLWADRARNSRRLMSAALLFWFNVEIWRHVVLVFIRG